LTNLAALGQSDLFRQLHARLRAAARVLIHEVAALLASLG